MSDLKLRFVAASRGNRFMRELLEALAFECRQLGVDAAVAVDLLPPADSRTAYVVIPHEFFPLLPNSLHPEPRLYHRMIALCVEHPGTQWFEETATLAKAFPISMDINIDSQRELKRRGLSVEHLQLGYTTSWDYWHHDPSARGIDILYMGSQDDRRAELLASYGEQFSRYVTQLLLPPLEPKRSPRPNYLVGEAKYQRLCQAKILLNLHRQTTRATEWLRIIEAMSNGCVVVSEHSVDVRPLEVGRHLVSGHADNLAHLCLSLLEDPDALSQTRDAAYEFLRTELLLRSGVEKLVSIGDALLENAPAPPTAPRPPTARRRGALPEQAPAPADTFGFDPLAAGLKRVAVDVLSLRHAVRRLELAVAGEPDQARATVIATNRYPSTDPPRVSVVMPVLNQPTELGEAIRSVAASYFDDLELLVLDDGSEPATRAAVIDALAHYPWLSALALSWRVNRGPGAARSEILRHARGDYVLLLDADNGIYPTALERLVATLDNDPTSAFAYCILEVRTRGRPVGVLSSLPWEPARLRRGNYIDALSLVRRSALTELGGFRDDPRLLGWEDFDLWCRAAEAGLRGALVPEILAWYRRTSHSTVTTMFDHGEALSLIAEAAPRLFAGELDT